MINKKILLFTILFILMCQTGCGPTYSKNKYERKVHIFAVRQLPQPPVYNRIKKVHLASPLPNREKHPASNRIINPVFQFDAQDSTLEEIAMILANTAKYSSFCDASIAKRKFSIVTLGTIDEIAKEIEKEANIEVVVDHQTKEVRFLEKRGL